MTNRAVFSIVLILAVAAGVIIGYAFFGLDARPPLVIAVTVTSGPEPTVTEARSTATMTLEQMDSTATMVRPLATVVPQGYDMIVGLPECSSRTTPRGSLCQSDTATYPLCSETPSLVPCYKH